jgi:hypothetical protein
MSASQFEPVSGYYSLNLGVLICLVVVGITRGKMQWLEISLHILLNAEAAASLLVTVAALNLVYRTNTPSSNRNREL